MSAPNIELVKNESMSTLRSDSDEKIKYLLFSDDYYFENWTDWVNDSNNSPNNNQS